MGKKLSANELQEHNDRLLRGKEEDMNSLAERLEKNRSKFDSEDQSILSWGIGILHRIEKDEKEDAKRMTEQYEYYKNGDFIKGSGWDKINIYFPFHHKEAVKKGLSDVKKIVEEAYSNPSYNLAQEYTQYFLSHLQNKYSGKPEAYKRLIGAIQIKLQSNIKKAKDSRDDNQIKMAGYINIVEQMF